MQAMDVSLVVLLVVFVMSIVAHGALAAYQWHRASQQSATATQLLSSAVDSCRQLEQCVRQRSSMADEVAALRSPLEQSVGWAKVLNDEVHKATVEMAGNLAGIPKMTEALVEIAKRQVEILEQIKATAKTLYSALYDKDPRRTFKPASPEVSDQEYEVNRLMQEHGMARAEALEQIDHDQRLSGFRVTR
jgi:hypothetical protein